MRSRRISLILVLVITFLLVKSHLNSIGHGQQKGDHGQGVDAIAEYVVEERGAHIELVSKNRVRVLDAPARSRAASTTFHSHTPKDKTYLEPTNPATPRRWEPETIPVDVPGWEFLDNENDYDVDWQTNWWEENDGQTRQRRPTPPKPEVTPKSDRIVVVGKMLWEDTAWLEDELPE